MTQKSETFRIYTPLARRPLSSKKKAEIAAKVDAEIEELEAFARERQRAKARREKLAEIETAPKARKPYGYGTAAYREGMARYKALKAKQQAEREARAAAIAEKRALTPQQEASIETWLKINVHGAPTDFRGRLLQPEPAH